MAKKEIKETREENNNLKEIEKRIQEISEPEKKVNEILDLDEANLKIQNLLTHMDLNTYKSN